MPPAASPEPTVIALAVIAAVTSTAPLTEIAGPVPIEATTVTFEIAMAIAGATATLPLAPVCASVVIECVPEASSVRAAPPVRTAVSSIEATLLSLTTWTASEAPTPTDLPVPPSLEASAFAVEDAFDSAFSDTFPVPTATVVAGCAGGTKSEALPGGPRAGSDRTTAQVCASTTLIANEPATPMSPPLAPAVDSAANSWIGSPVPAMRASRTSPCDVVWAP